MHLPRLALGLLLSSTCASCQDSQLTGCSLLGPIYPPPQKYSSAKAIRSAQDQFKHQLSAAIADGTTPWGAVGPVNASISIGVFSTQDDSLLAEYHHQPSAEALQAHITGGYLSGETLYRVGSITKLLSTYTLLSEIGDAHWHEPVIKFIPELQALHASDPVHSVDWSAVTLGSLTSHMSGLPHDYTLTDLSSTSDTTPPGLPRLNSSEIVSCGGIGQQPCSRAESLRLILAEDPASPSYQTPMYSNTAYQLLGMALENITGLSFQDNFISGLTKPLNLKRTFLDLPDKATNAVIADLQEPKTWETNLGILTPAGGVWSTLNDLTTIARSILNSTILPPSTTRSWLKPDTRTNHPIVTVGKSWEIFRMSVPIHTNSTSTRDIDLYTKNGGYGPYNAEIILSPDHNIGIITLVADLGDSSSSTGATTLWSLNELATQIFIPAAEAAAREIATANLIGTFKSTDGLNSSITLASLPNTPGIAVTSLIYNGTDFLTDFLSQTGKAAQGGFLQYMGLKSNTEMAFRAMWQAPKYNGREGVFHMDCIGTWAEVDIVKYGGVGYDEFIVEFDESGKAKGVGMPFLRTRFDKRVS